jgi:phosphoribosyl 1,2-cyclic phosphate phosphodiesterase
LQLPSFHCSCRTCQQAREDPSRRKTRAALAIKGNKTILIDSGPDIALQLERESIRKVEAIFITHRHFDHIGGLAEFVEPASTAKWQKIKLFLPIEDVPYVENELSHLKKVFEITPVNDCFETEIDGVLFKAVKTNHTSDSYGYLLEHHKRVAYLSDGIRPPEETVKHLLDIDCLILEATMDELDEDWKHFDIKGALDFWKEIGCRECILTHMSYHSWKKGMLVEGFNENRRKQIVSENPGLKIAYDGMRLQF